MPKFFNLLNFLWVWGSWDIWHSIPIELKNLKYYLKESFLNQIWDFPASQPIEGTETMHLCFKKKEYKVWKERYYLHFSSFNIFKLEFQEFQISFYLNADWLQCNDQRKDGNRSLIFSDCSGLAWTKMNFEQNHGQWSWNLKKKTESSFPIMRVLLTNESNLSELRTIANLSQPRPVCKSGVRKG